MAAMLLMGDSNQLIFHRIIEPSNIKVKEIKGTWSRKDTTRNSSTSASKQCNLSNAAKQREIINRIAKIIVYVIDPIYQKKEDQIKTDLMFILSFKD